jgi:predicted RNA binding protein YcfA (HicA-like mRNA interferase family)
VKIPRDCSGTDLAKALRVLGYAVVRQSGSHIRLRTEDNGEHHVTVPNHRPMKVGTLSGVLRAVSAHHGITVEELLTRLRL